MSLCLMLAFLAGCGMDNNKDARNANTDLTAQDQSESAGDRAITQQIRKDIVADNSLSTAAKNVKIITIDGVVTLKGSINNNQERIVIIEKAKQANGVKNVVDELILAK